MASKAQNDEIIDPNGLDLFRLTMMVITASICGGIFSLAGDMAAGGANTGAVIVSWGICFIGVFALMMVFNGLSQARPDLTGGIYAYAAAGFGDYIGFNSAWGYWISACLSNVSFALLLFSALGYFFPAFGAGNNLLSIVCASVFLLARPTGRIFCPVTARATAASSPSRWMRNWPKSTFWTTKPNPVPISTSFGQKP